MEETGCVPSSSPLPQQASIALIVLVLIMFQMTEVRLTFWRCMQRGPASVNDAAHSAKSLSSSPTHPRPNPPTHTTHTQALMKNHQHNYKPGVSLLEEGRRLYTVTQREEYCHHVCTQIYTQLPFSYCGRSSLKITDKHGPYAHMFRCTSSTPSSHLSSHSLEH